MFICKGIPFLIWSLSSTHSILLFAFQRGHGVSECVCVCVCVCVRVRVCWGDGTEKLRTHWMPHKSPSCSNPAPAGPSQCGVGRLYLLLIALTYPFQAIIKGLV